jgi:hypothetical protein
MLLETVYAPRVSLPNADDVVNDGSVQVPLPLEVGAGVAGVEAGAELVAVGLGWVGEDDGEVPGEEADGEDGEGDAADDADADAEAEAGAGDGDADAPAVGSTGPVAAAVFSIMAACLALVAACRGT